MDGLTASAQDKRRNDRGSGQERVTTDPEPPRSGSSRSAAQREPAAVTQRGAASTTPRTAAHRTRATGMANAASGSPDEHRGKRIKQRVTRAGGRHHGIRIRPDSRARAGYPDRSKSDVLGGGRRYASQQTKPETRPHRQHEPPASPAHAGADPGVTCGDALRFSGRDRTRGPRRVRRMRARRRRCGITAMRPWAPHRPGPGRCRGSPAGPSEAIPPAACASRDPLIHQEISRSARNW